MTSLCRAAGIDTREVDFPEINITDSASVHGVVSEVKPDFIVNCAAYTAVDAAEQNVSQAFAVNADGTANLALAARAAGAAVVHFSTDYVFDGKAGVPYIETDLPCPLSVYGASKLKGEQLLAELCPRHFVLRIAWLYGLTGANFVKTIRSLAIKKKLAGEPLMVVNDQIGTPTWTVDVCRQVFELISTEAYGLYHSTNEGCCSWFDFACAIIAAAGIGAAVQPCATSQFPRPAPRPAYGVLENRALKQLGLNRMPSWQEGFRRFLSRESEQA
jgi:dTDP-4-dehydrorhamnose reductase